MEICIWQGFCSEANETENLSSALDCSVFPDNRELFGNESNKKKKDLFRLGFVLLFFLWKAGVTFSAGNNMFSTFSARQLFSVYSCDLQMASLIKMCGLVKL